jgi:hypothetical protein
VACEIGYGRYDLVDFRALAIPTSKIANFGFSADMGFFSFDIKICLHALPMVMYEARCPVHHTERYRSHPKLAMRHQILRCGSLEVQSIVAEECEAVQASIIGG